MLNIKEWRISLWWLVWGRNVTFHAVLCSYTWTVHITLFAVGLQWCKMLRKCPQHPSSCSLTTAAEEKQTSHRLLFLFFFGFFTSWYESICNRFDCRICCDSFAGIFKWILMILFEKLSNMKESRLLCSSRAQLTCSILLDLPLSVICICIKCSNLFIKTSLHSNFPNNLFHIKSHISCSSLYLHVNHAH